LCSGKKARENASEIRRKNGSENDSFVAPDGSVKIHVKICVNFLVAILFDGILRRFLRRFLQRFLRIFFSKVFGVLRRAFAEVVTEVVTEVFYGGFYGDFYKGLSGVFYEGFCVPLSLCPPLLGRSPGAKKFLFFE